jgi:uncharacterized Zn-binding protein involved in type VI secretion
MPPAARVTDMHVCPMVTVLVPHVGGPILPPGAPTVLIGFLPAATVSDMCTCVGPPDVIVMGSVGVLINYLPAARMGDPTAHGGVIILGEPTVMIGEVGSPSPGGAGAAAVSNGLAATGSDNPINANKSVYGTPGTAGSSSAAPVAGGTPKQKAVVQAVNPKNGQNNCGHIIDAANDRLTGKNPNAVAPDEQDGSFSDIEKRFNTKIDYHKTFQQAYDAVKQGGNGTSAIIAVIYSNNNSHVILMNNDNGTVGILEGQNWNASNPSGVITDVSAADSRYNGDGKSNVGYGIIPASP